MEFCDVCGSMMLPSSNNGIKVFKCKCGEVKSFDEDKSNAYKVKTIIEQPVRNELTNISDIMNWKEQNLRSTIKNFICSQCGYTKAHLETRQTRRADEGMTHFITCLKCGKMKKIGS